MVKLIWFWLFMLFTVFSSLAIDYYTGQSSSVVIFFIATVVVPFLMGAMASRAMGKRFIELAGLIGGKIFNIATFLMGFGLTVMFYYAFITPLSKLFVGTPYYQAIRFMYLPLTKSIPLAVIPPAVIIIYYIWVAFGEELLKWFGTISIYQVLVNKIGHGISLFLGYFLSLTAWLFLHFFSWGGYPPIGMLMGYILSFIFYLPYFVGESIVSPEKGIQARMSLFSAIAGHFIYDALIEFENIGIALSSFQGMMIGFFPFAIGSVILFYEYMRYLKPPYITILPPKW
jgi:hypothetical protein